MPRSSPGRPPAGHRPGLHRSRARLQRRLHGAGHRRRRRRSRRRTGYVRAGAPLTFPTTHRQGVDDLPGPRPVPGPAARLRPHGADGLRPDASMQQIGMRVGIPNAGQVNALETLNIRGERSVTCKGAFDAHPSTGPLPPGAPAACEAFRKQPDALERAAELDAQYGRNPDLAALPMYCVVVVVQGSVRHQGHAHDGEQRRQLRDGRAAVRFDDRRAAARQGRDHLREVGGARVQRRPRQSRAGRRKPTTQHGRRAARRSAPGAASPAIPTTPSACRAARAAARAWRSAANLATLGICEQTGGVVPGPGVAQRHRADADDQGHDPRQRRHRQPVVHRPRRASMPHARRRRAGARRAQGPGDRLLRPARPVHGACPRRSCPTQPYASFARRRRRGARRAKPLQGMRIAILREHMVKRTPNHEAISDQIDQEIKTVLRDRLGAELVETVDAGVSRRSRRAEPDVHVRRRLLGDAAAHHAGDLLAARRRRASWCSPCRATT